MDQEQVLLDLVFLIWKLKWEEIIKWINSINIWENNYICIYIYIIVTINDVVHYLVDDSPLQLSDIHNRTFNGLNYAHQTTGMDDSPPHLFDMHNCSFVGKIFLYLVTLGFGACCLLNFEDNFVLIWLVKLNHYFMDVGIFWCRTMLVFVSCLLICCVLFSIFYVVNFVDRSFRIFVCWI